MIIIWVMMMVVRRNKTRLRRFFVLSTLLVLSSCAGYPPEMASLKQHHNDLIVPDDFGVCKGYGCRYYIKAGLSDEEWHNIVEIFENSAKNFDEEKVLIKRAIGLFEQFIGPKTGTDTDNAGAQLIGFSTHDQMDCIDEAFNTTTYLYLLRKFGLIKLHTLGKPLHRGNYINRWPHNTATIHEMGKQDILGDGHYVVDSWFHANGVPPEIIPAALWSKGWSPDQK
ncbi:MAG: hypothetical protein K9G26_00225 [Emcibacter sp.]|nr:hypothetical protein [Emcibacter sp.]